MDTNQATLDINFNQCINDLKQRTEELQSKLIINELN